MERRRNLGVAGLIPGDAGEVVGRTRRSLAVPVDADGERIVVADQPKGHVLGVLWRYIHGHLPLGIKEVEDRSGVTIPIPTQAAELGEGVVELTMDLGGVIRSGRKRLLPSRRPRPRPPGPEDTRPGPGPGATAGT